MDNELDICGICKRLKEDCDGHPRPRSPENGQEETDVEE
jgi:hypothetical protein